jgi:hypothetical protein
MADLSVRPVATDIKPMQGMSLAEMMNFARGAQQFQQAEQLLPMQLEYYQSQLGVQRGTEAAQIKKAQEEASRAETEARRSGVELRKTEETAQDVIERAKAESGLAQTQEQEAKLKLQSQKLDLIVDKATTLYTHPLVIKSAKDPKFAQENKQQLTNLLKTYVEKQGQSLGLSKEEIKKFGEEYINEATNNPQNVQRFLGDKLIAQLDAKSRTDAMLGKGVERTFGSGAAVVETSPFGLTPVGQIRPGTLTKEGMAPFTYTTETGETMVKPGVQGGIVNLAPEGQAPVAAPPPQQRRGGAAAPAAPAAAPAAPAAPNTAVAPPSAAAPLTRQPYETYDAYKERVGRLSKLPVEANTLLNPAMADSIPNMENINNKILNLLEKKNVSIGPISEAIRQKTGGIGLNPDQQEVMKYLEQRIRQQAARTNQDQDSQRNAFGNFGTAKEALRDIIYTDKGVLAAQRLRYEGIKNYQGSTSSPNLAAVADFDNKFTGLANPDVTYLIGIVGNKKENQLTKSDLLQLNKHFGAKSDDEINKIFKQRDELLRLVKGAR